MIKKIFGVIKTRGFKYLLIAGVRSLLHVRLKAYKSCVVFFRGNSGLEIGGPSPVFRRGGMFPIYADAAHVDNCNFGYKTIWEGEIKEGSNFFYDKRRAPGVQYVAEASDLANLKDKCYDFILSSHVLEHIANPLKALNEWLRIIKEYGVVFLIVPHKDGTFDHRRQVTTLEHLIEDFDQKIGEDDLSHLDEILEMHDLERDPEAGDLNAFSARSKKNFENRGLHHHVFDTHLAVELINYIGLQIIVVEIFAPANILIVAQKLPQGSNVDNTKFRAVVMEPVWHSPFPSDRLSKKDRSGL